MKIASIIARTLLGLIFVVFGLNAFFHFIPMPAPTGQAGAFMGAMFTSGYLYAVKIFEITGGLLLISGRFVPLGLTLVGPVIVNILFFDIFLDPSGLLIGLVVAVLALIVLTHHRKASSRSTASTSKTARDAGGIAAPETGGLARFGGPDLWST